MITATRISFNTVEESVDCPVVNGGQVTIIDIDVQERSLRLRLNERAGVFLDIAAVDQLMAHLIAARLLLDR